MVYLMGKRQLCEVWQVFCGKVNDVIVCRDQNAPGNVFYTLLVVRKHSMAGRMIRILEKSEQMEDSPFLRSFSFEGEICFLFEYREVRSIRSFFMGKVRSLSECEKIVMNLVLECINASSLPPALLYLILTQDQVHLGQDGSVYFTYFLNLEELDEDRTEGQCVAACAKLITELLEERDPGTESMELLERKMVREAYSGFPELYRDISMTTAPKVRISLRKRLIMWWKSRKDFFFRLLMIASMVLLVLAVIALLSQLLFGDGAILKILYNGFDKIGTERLN